MRDVRVERRVRRHDLLSFTHVAATGTNSADDRFDVNGRSEVPKVGQLAGAFDFDINARQAHRSNASHDVRPGTQARRVVSRCGLDRAAPVAAASVLDCNGSANVDHARQRRNVSDQRPREKRNPSSNDRRCRRQPNAADRDGCRQIRAIGTAMASVRRLTKQANRRPAARAKPRMRDVRVERRVRPHSLCEATIAHCERFQSSSTTREKLRS